MYTDWKVIHKKNYMCYHFGRQLRQNWRGPGFLDCIGARNFSAGPWQQGIRYPWPDIALGWLVCWWSVCPSHFWVFFALLLLSNRPRLGCRVSGLVFHEKHKIHTHKVVIRFNALKLNDYCLHRILMLAIEKSIVIFTLLIWCIGSFGPKKQKNQKKEKPVIFLCQSESQRIFDSSLF